MELAQRLRQARLEAGLSQKALCGDRITRNMLSQIENGSARPSMDTLRYLAQQLGKPLGYFLEEDAVTSPNQALMEQLRSASASQALQLLNRYQSPDPTFDNERWLLETLVCLELAEAALEQNRPGYARSLLDRAAVAGSRTPYCTPELLRRRVLLCFRAGIRVGELESQLPSLTPELLLRAENALEQEAFSRCHAFLEACTDRPAAWYYCKARALFAQSNYPAAREHFEAGWDAAPEFCCRRLEDCCREMADFAGAYFYACKLRELKESQDFTKI